MTLEIYCARHGQSMVQADDTLVLSNRQHLLTEEGVRQAHALGEYTREKLLAGKIKGPITIHTSEYPRAIETAVILRSKLRFPISQEKMEICIHGDLNEMSWVGREPWPTMTQLQEKYQHQDIMSKFEDPDFKLDPAGESVSDVYRRVSDFMHRLETDPAYEDIHSTAIIVSHQYVMQAIYARRNGLGPQGMHRFKFTNAVLQQLSFSSTGEKDKPS